MQPTLAGEAHGRSIHPSWHWALMVIDSADGRTRTHPLHSSTVVRANPRIPVPRFLFKAAEPTPPWTEETIQRGTASTTILGDLGAHTCVYPIGWGVIEPILQELQR
ncbi:MAG: hypothetical protein Q8R28_03505 [Dehalococcoidia bacterium]|nr:hypothetical protein [Dehalococcoidia bacterium]